MNGFHDFFKKIIDERNIQEPGRLIVVTHLVSGSEDFIFALNDVVPIAAIIPKPNSINHHVRSVVSDRIPILDWTRDEIKLKSDQFVTDIQNLVGAESFAVVDTGGYFSHVLRELHSTLKEQFMGVVEDTENGHQKYEILLEAEAPCFPCPVISVARSTLKDPEDFLVGQAIVFSSEALLREQGEILNSKEAVVLGYGKIGRSIAYHLRQKSVHVKVLDVDAGRQVLALAHGFSTGRKEILLKDADILYCATGNRSLRRGDILSIKRGAYVFTATSADDEIENHVSLMERAHHDRKI